MPLVVADHILRKGSLSFLQVGAFDGSQNDELQSSIDRFAIKGILVEPQPEVFKRLTQLHGQNENLTLLNAAIDREAGSRPLFMSRRRDLECASFDRNHLVKHGVEPSEIYSSEVECLTISGVLDRARVDAVDLIQIDAEGHDYEIIKTIDFQKCRPRILRFEYRHLSSLDLDQCLEMLAALDYKFIVEELDIICILDD